MSDSVINMMLWLLAFIGASIAASFIVTCLMIVVTSIEYNWGLPSPGELMLGTFYMAIPVGGLALAPAVLGDALWEICGIRPSAGFLTGLGAVVGFGLCLLMASEDMEPMEFIDWFVVSGFGMAGAVGGLSFGCLRKDILASKPMNFPDFFDWVRVPPESRTC